jgi:hypothetical protein
VKDVIHGTLIRGAGILQPEGHDHILEQSYCPGTLNAVLCISSGAMKI